MWNSRIHLPAGGLLSRAASGAVTRLKPRLRVVGVLHEEPRVRRRELLRQGHTHYTRLTLLKRWVRAKERLGPTEPKVHIGGERAPRSLDEVYMPRTLKSAGIAYLDEVVKMPRLVRRLLGAD